MIRKIDGASRFTIIWLFIGEQARHISVASLAGLPAPFLLGSAWFENYAFRINQVPLLFLVPLLVIFFLSIVVTVAQIISLAAIKPGRGESITRFFRS